MSNLVVKLKSRPVSQISKLYAWNLITQLHVKDDKSGLSTLKSKTNIKITVKMYFLRRMFKFLQLVGFYS